jgi:hypothetical protein
MGEGRRCAAGLPRVERPAPRKLGHVPPRLLRPRLRRPAHAVCALREPGRPCYDGPVTLLSTPAFPPQRTRRRPPLRRCLPTVGASARRPRFVLISILRVPCVRLRARLFSRGLVPRARWTRSAVAGPSGCCSRSCGDADPGRPSDPFAHQRAHVEPWPWRQARRGSVATPPRAVWAAGGYRDDARSDLAPRRCRSCSSFLLPNSVAGDQWRTSARRVALSSGGLGLLLREDVRSALPMEPARPGRNGGRCPAAVEPAILGRELRGS